MTFASVLLMGFLLGLKHATEADHLAAVATLVTRHGTFRDALRQGAAWGVGHTVTLMLVGGVALWLGRAMPPRFEQALECAVGAMLILLGADVLRRMVKERIHFHTHAHGDGLQHFHAHRHAPAAARSDAVPSFAGLRFFAVPAEEHLVEPHEHAHPHGLPGRALLVGMMHGMAGSAALMLLSVGLAPSLGIGLLYLFVFGVGSMLGMVLLSAVIGLPLRASASALGGAQRAMSLVVGVLSCALGVAVLYRVATS